MITVKEPTYAHIEWRQGATEPILICPMTMEEARAILPVLRVLAGMGAPSHFAWVTNRIQSLLAAAEAHKDEHDAALNQGQGAASSSKDSPAQGTENPRVGGSIPSLGTT